LKGIDDIVNDILELVDLRQKSEEKKCSDVVAAIHSIWMEIGLVLGKKMDELREKERRSNG